MSGRPHIKITESVEDLREILKEQKRIRLSGTCYAKKLVERPKS